MKKIAGLLLGVFIILAIALISEKISFARVTSSAIDRDVWCVGVSGSELCVDSSGNFIPTTDDVADLGTASLQFQDGYFDGTVYADAISNDGAYAGTTGTFSGQVMLQNVSSTTLRTLTPGAEGALVFCSTYDTMCVSTGTGVGAWVLNGSTAVLRDLIPCDQ